MSNYPTMLVVEAGIKVFERVLCRSNLYRFSFPVRISPAEIKIQQHFMLSQTCVCKKYTHILKARHCYIFGKEIASSNLQRYSQADRPFWKVQLKGFDPKDFWEIARGWQWLPAYLGSAKDSKGQKDTIDGIDDWLAANPYPNGLAWAVNLDVAVRSANLLLIYFLSKEKRFFGQLWQHYSYIKKRIWLSRGSMQNNHLLGELTMLTIMASLFAQNECNKYRRELETEFSRQFYSDGTNIEQSMRYHAFSLQFALLARFFLCIDLPFLEHALDFVLMMRKPDGIWPSFGDDDMGCVFRLNVKPMTGDYEALLGFLGLIYKDGRAKYVIKTLPPEPKLFMEKAEDKWNDLEETEPELSKLFPDGGFWVTRTGWDKDASWFMVKFGPHKWHAHADIFHMELSIGGKPVLVDSGTYRYNNVPEERRYFRSTAAHNCMVFDDTDQSKQLTTFRWGKTAKVIDWKVKETEKGFTFYGSHDGYACKKLKYHREIDGREDLKELLIRETLDGKARGETTAYWHFAPSIDLVKDGADYRIISDGHPIGLFRYDSNDKAEAEIMETPYSAHYGHLGNKKTIAVRAYKQSLQPLIIESHFIFESGGEHESI